jgi:hypothetical protein
MPDNFKLQLRNVKLYPKEPRLFMIDPDGPVIRDLDRRGSRVQAGARRLVRVRTGKLLSSIRKNRGANTRFPYVEIIAGGKGARYVMFEHDGTPPHIITVRRKKSLRFMSGGVVVFRKSVRHPGTTGTKFLTRALPLGGG